MSTESILRCPCLKKTTLTKMGKVYTCASTTCEHNRVEQGFGTSTENKPILISPFRCDTIFDDLVEVSSIERTTGLVSAIRQRFKIKHKKSYQNAKVFADELLKTSDTPLVLIIGGATQGAGTEVLYKNKNIEIMSCDVYDTQFIDIICDAHYLPFEDASFEGVWIQAVLEHVVEPNLVVDEIYRVLRDDGVVYAETPFLQQVHEGCYDFTRYTMLGHRYLFKRFQDITCGVLDGPGEVFVWNIRYLIWGVSRSKSLSRLLGMTISPIRFLINFMIPCKYRYDNSSGVFFLGKKSYGASLTHKDLKYLYRGVIK